MSKPGIDPIVLAYVLCAISGALVVALVVAALWWAYG